MAQRDLRPIGEGVETVPARIYQMYGPVVVRNKCTQDCTMYSEQQINPNLDTILC